MKNTFFSGDLGNSMAIELT